MQVGLHRFSLFSTVPERLSCRAQVSFTTLPVLASALLSWNKISVLCNPTSPETVLKRERIYGTIHQFFRIWSTQFGRILLPEMQASSGRKMMAIHSRTGYICVYNEIYNSVIYKMISSTQNMAYIVYIYTICFLQ